MHYSKKLFKRLIEVDKENFNIENRTDRANFIVKIFPQFLRNSVLDVGCGNAILKKFLPNKTAYTGIDISGNPDLVIDLEKEKLSQFEDNSFYTIICTDVLEHLDNIHDVFDDLCRVSKKYIILSLPNPWAILKYLLLRGGGTYKFYGLPIYNPNDRHKWFFNYDDAFLFVQQRAKMNNFELICSFPSMYIKPSIKQQIFNIILKLYYGKRYSYKNLYYGNIWVILQRKINNSTD